MRLFIKWAQIALTALIFIAFLNNSKVHAEDGCGITFWRCGDICISFLPQEDNVTIPMCHCGSDIIQIQEPRWCCSDEPCNGLGPWGHDNGLGSGYMHGGNCTTGKVLHLSQPCHGKCNTNSKLDSIVSNERATEPCTYRDKTKNISQCVLSGSKNDRIFNCVNRADENPFSTHDKTNSTTLDLSAILTSCTTSKGNVNFRPGILGLRCPNRYFGPDECAPLWIWCKRNLLPFFVTTAKRDF